MPDELLAMKALMAYTENLACAHTSASQLPAMFHIGSAMAYRLILADQGHDDWAERVKLLAYSRLLYPLANFSTEYWPR